MKKAVVLLTVSLSFITLFPLIPLHACTSMIVTKGASKDGSVMVTYTCDGEFHPTLRRADAADHTSGDSLEITDWSGKFRGRIAQVAHTYAYVGLINEYQLAIGETTFEGREELINPNGLLGYYDLMLLALQRAKTAREAIKVMTGLVETYSYRSSGESFSIADKKEAWIMEMIGPGPDKKGAVWVARKVPEGYIAAHANKAVIEEFPLNEPDNCLYSKNVISFATEKGYYDPKTKQPFRFNEAYCPSDPKNRRSCSTRVWSIFRRAAPSLKLSPDYHRAVDGAKPYPLWIKPDKKLTLSDVFSLMRDHYEGTDFDLTAGIDAGPFGTTLRCRPLSWTVDSVEYGWERPISTQQTGYSFVSQSRGHLADAVGGVLWYGVDDTYFTCYTPLYCSITRLPKPFTVGTLDKFSWESAWWTFNFVSNYAQLKYTYMVKDMQAVQQKLEGEALSLQPAIEKTALELHAADPGRAAAFLTDYSVSHGETVVTRWRELGEFLLTKYNDGFVKDENNRPQEKGYPEPWLRQVIKSKPDQVRLKKRKEGAPESKLID